MEGYEAFKIARENSGYSIREFANLTKISITMMVYYENGRKSLLGMSVKKAMEVFELLDISLHDFYIKYYFEKINVSNNVEQYKKIHDREYSLKILYKRIKNRLYKLKEREHITIDTYKRLSKDAKDTFKLIESIVGETETITDEMYKTYILELEYRIGISLKENILLAEQNEVSGRINDCILRSDFTYKDLATFIGITNRRLSNCKNTEGFDTMKVENALKICNVFSIRFEDIFC